MEHAGGGASVWKMVAGEVSRPWEERGGYIAQALTRQPSDERMCGIQSRQQVVLQ